MLKYADVILDWVFIGFLPYVWWVLLFGKPDYAFLVVGAIGVASVWAESVLARWNYYLWEKKNGQ